MQLEKRRGRMRAERARGASWLRAPGDDLSEIGPVSGSPIGQRKTSLADLSKNGLWQTMNHTDGKFLGMES